MGGAEGWVLGAAATGDYHRGIRFGIFTPTEAAVVAAVYAIVISTVIYRELTLKQFVQVLIAAGRSTAMVMFLVGCAMVAAWLITVAHCRSNWPTFWGRLSTIPSC